MADGVSCMQGLTGLLTRGEEGEELFAALKQVDPNLKDAASELDDFIVWVWRQTISVNRYVREACMWLLEHLCDFWKPDCSMGKHLSQSNTCLMKRVELACTDPSTFSRF